MEQPAFEFSNRQQIDDSKVVRQNFDLPNPPEPKPERVVNELGDSDPGADFRAGKPKIERPIGGNNARKEFDAGKPDMVDPIGKAKPKVKTTIKPADAAPVQGDDSVERQLAAINERVKTLERDSGVGDNYKSSMGEATKRTIASHPFLCYASETEITVGQGYIWAGTLAFYNWPKSDILSSIAIPVDGSYVLGFELYVNPFSGEFSDAVTPYAVTFGPYVPTLALATKGSLPSIQLSSGGVFWALADVVVSDGKALVSQRWFGDIHVVVMMYRCKDTSGALDAHYYECSLGYEVNFPAVVSVEISGTTYRLATLAITDITGDWDAPEDEGGPLT